MPHVLPKHINTSWFISIKERRKDSKKGGKKKHVQSYLSFADTKLPTDTSRLSPFGPNGSI